MNAPFRRNVRLASLALLKSRPRPRSQAYVAPEIAALDSPIEHLFRQALIPALAELRDHGWSTIFIPAGEISSVSDFPPTAPGRIVVGEQIEIGQYRADFLAVVHPKRWHPSRVAFECDGHDYHERTPEQARYDRARDRYFYASYVYPVRYTGSEIVADPAGCAADALQLAIRLASPRMPGDD